MIGVLLVTHLDFGEKLLAAAERILGKQESCMTVSININSNMQEILQDIEQAFLSLDNGDGVLVITDMFGGTPSNLSLSMIGDKKLEVITGANLPMLLKIFNSRELPLQELAMEAKSAGRQGILVAGEVLKRKVANG